MMIMKPLRNLKEKLNIILKFKYGLIRDDFIFKYEQGPSKKLEQRNLSENFEDENFLFKVQNKINFKDRNDDENFEKSPTSKLELDLSDVTLECADKRNEVHTFTHDDCDVNEIF